MRPGLTEAIYCCTRYHGPVVYVCTSTPPRYATQTITGQQFLTLGTSIISSVLLDVAGIGCFRSIPRVFRVLQSIILRIRSRFVLKWKLYSVSLFCVDEKSIVPIRKLVPTDLICVLCVVLNVLLIDLYIPGVHQSSIINHQNIS